MRYTLLYLLLFLPLWGMTQPEQQVRFGAPYPSVKSTKEYFLVDAPKKELIVLQKTPASKPKKENAVIELQVFNLNTLRPKHPPRQLALPDNAHLLAPLHFHDTTYLFYRDIEQDRDNKRLFAQAINTDTPRVAGDPICLIGDEDLYDYSLTQSPNQKILLIKGLKTLENKEDSLYLSFHSVGENLQSLNQTLVKLPYPKSRITVRDFCVDNRGIPYLLLKVYDSDDGKLDVIKTKVEGSWRKKNTVNYHLEILTVNPYTGAFAINKLTLEDRLPKNFHLEAGPNNKVYCAGYYTSKDSKTGDVRGLFVWELEPITGVLRERYYPVPLEVMTQYEPPETQRAQARAALKGAAEVSGLDLNTIQFQSDNSLLINAEVFRIVTRSYMSNRQLQSYRLYLHQGIFATKINPDGTLAWINKIPKNQERLRTSDGIGYTYFSTPNRHYYLHMDHPKNTRLGKFDVPNTYKDGDFGNIVVATLDHQTGELDRDIIIHTRKQRNSYNYRLSPFSHRKIIATTDGKAILKFTLERKQDVLMEVDMEE